MKHIQVVSKRLFDLQFFLFNKVFEGIAFLTCFNFFRDWYRLVPCSSLMLNGKSCCLWSWGKIRRRSNINITDVSWCKIEGLMKR